ncbi:MAG: hypothetical protein PHY05_09775 [Methanothrix sp.]|nr:hypothetical protein [Methanothrix sp.]
MAEKQKTAKIANPQSQKKERLTIVYTKAPLGKPVSSRAGYCLQQVAQIKMGSFHRLQGSNTDELLKEILAGYSQTPPER